MLFANFMSIDVDAWIHYIDATMPNIPTLDRFSKELMTLKVIGLYTRNYWSSLKDYERHSDF